LFVFYVAHHHSLSSMFDSKYLFFLTCDFFIKLFFFFLSFFMSWCSFLFLV
jgi:hypothetical protein